MVGAPYSVDNIDIQALFERWGEVISVERGTSEFSAPNGIKGEIGSGWIWNGTWEVRWFDIACSCCS